MPPSVANHEPSFDVAGPDVVERPARLFKADSYDFNRGLFTEKLTITPEQLDGIIGRSAVIDKIPLDLSPVHGKTDLNLPPEVTGYFSGKSLRREGDWIMATAMIPKAINNNLKNLGLSIDLSRTKGVINRVCVTPNPKSKGACLFSEDSDAFSFSDGELEESAEPESEAAPSESVDSAYLQQSLEVLRANGFDLPEDTTASNILERIVVAGRALATAKTSNQPQEQPQETEHPAPIAMSEDTMSRSIKSDGSVQFSEPALSIPANMRKAYRKQYVQRIERLVQSRRIPARYANETLAPMLGKTHEDFQFSVDSEGDVAAPVLDGILMALEQLPDGCMLTGPLAATERALRTKGKTHGDVSFSLTVPENDVEHGAEFGEDPEEQAEVTKTMIKMSGA